MREYAKNQILENYGAEALAKIESKEYNGNLLLAYADSSTFEIIGSILANHSLSIDDALSLLGVDMDSFSAGMGWDDWDWDALKLIDIE